MDKVVIYGNKAVAIEVYYSLKCDTEYEIAGFTVDSDLIDNDLLCSLPVTNFNDIQKYYPPQHYKMIIGVGYVGNNKVRKERYKQAKDMGYAFINCISPNAILCPDIVIGENCFIGHHTYLSHNVCVGNNVIIGNGCSIGHNVTVSDHCFMSDSVAISGSVNIGENCYLGTNSTIRNRVSIGHTCVIGAGAIVLENVEDNGVLLGEPATLLPISSDNLNLG